MEKECIFEELPESTKDEIVEILLKEKGFWDEESPGAEDVARENIHHYIQENNNPRSVHEWFDFAELIER